MMESVAALPRELAGVVRRFPGCFAEWASHPVPLALVVVGIDAAVWWAVAGQ
jgi:hypothetical protein